MIYAPWRRHCMRWLSAPRVSARIAASFEFRCLDRSASISRCCCCRGTVIVCGCDDDKKLVAVRLSPSTCNYCLIVADPFSIRYDLYCSAKKSRTSIINNLLFEYTNLISLSFL